MKNIFYIAVTVFGLLSTSSAYGQTRVLQDEEGVVVTDQDTVVIKIDKDYDEDHSEKKTKKNKFRVGLLDLGVSTYLYEDGLNHDEIGAWKLKYPNSHNWNLHIFRHRVNLLAESLFFEYGVSTNFRRYSFQEEISDISSGDEMTPILSTVPLRKSKLRTTYLEAPIMLTLNPKGKKFTVSVGGYAGMRIGSSIKTKGKEDGKVVIRDDYQLRDFTGGGIVRLGFGPVDFFCQVSSETLFNDGIEPELIPITFGISLVNF